VIEGGGACGIDNLETLCRPCHKQETAKLRKRLAQAKRAQLRLPMED
jgi:5-methylcytosine-specific restriction endonuclease McrA